MFLAAEFSRRGIPFKSVPELRMDGAIVSSSLIREKIAMGDLENANAMLNARPALYGEVTHGRQLAGRVLGAPTANLTIEYGILPPNGVYATVSEVDGKRYPAVTNIGVSPTFDCSGERRIETHIIGFSGDLYCRKLTVELAAKIRDEKKFSSPSALEAQIRLDCEEAIGILSERKL